MAADTQRVELGGLVIGEIREEADGRFVAVPADGGEPAGGFDRPEHAQRWLERRYSWTDVRLRGDEPALRGRALVVDDGEVNRVALAQVLGRLGLVVDVAADADAALARLAGTQYDVVLVDALLAGAQSVADRALRTNDPADPGPAIVELVTPGRAPATLVGADASLSRPFALDQLVVLLSRALTPSPSGRPTGD